MPAPVRESAPEVVIDGSDVPKELVFPGPTATPREPKKK
jgi:hypothetical protein